MGNDRVRRRVVLGGVAGGLTIVAGCATESADNNDDLKDRGYTKFVTDESGIVSIPPSCWPLESILIRDPDYEDKEITFDEDKDVDTAIEIELSSVQGQETGTIILKKGTDEDFS